VPKTANASPSCHAKHDSVFMLSPSSRSTAKPAAAWQLRYSFIFLIDEMQSRFYKMKRWAYNAVAAATNTLII
jgi:hypothetical protein